jgi:hypothetical protein
MHTPLSKSAGRVRRGTVLEDFRNRIWARLRQERVQLYSYQLFRGLPVYTRLPPTLLRSLEYDIRSLQQRLQ